jgi:hypothetical protein
LLVPILLIGCVSYQAAPLDRERLATDLAELRPPAPLGWVEAVAFAHAHNPELARLRDEARAAGLEIPPTTITGGVRDHEKMALARLDPLALLSIGPRGSASDTADARRAAKLAELIEAERRVAADIARCFLVARVLDAQTLPPVLPSAQRFVDAGLASEYEREAIGAAGRDRDAEKIAVRSERTKIDAELATLLGLAPSTPLQLNLDEAPEASIEGDRDRLLARPALDVAGARYAVADAAFREAVVRQYPTLELGPSFHWPLSTWTGFADVRVPFGADQPARAAEARRDAARHAFEAALIDALAEAESVTAEHAATSAWEAAQLQSARTADVDYRVELTRLDVDAQPNLSRLAAAARRAVRAARERRLASTDERRVRVMRAGVYGWPRSEDVR